jgi:hypothetical protein
MGKLVSWGLWHTGSQKDDCSSCGMAKKKGCCEDKHKVIQIEKQYNATSQGIIVHKPFTAILNHYIDYSSLLFNGKVTTYPFFSNAPPGNEEGPLYVLNCVYRI